MAGRGLLFLVLLHCLTFLASAQEVNVAAGKPANASSEYSNYPASSVTDGGTSWTQYKCYHSADNVMNSWLRVYLGAVYPMNKIVIYYRSEFSWRFVGTTINILNSTDGPGQNCATVINNHLNDAASTATFNCATAGSIVELRRDGDIQNVCEVQVWACSAGSYGAGCTGRCGQCAQGNLTCDHVTGDCPGGCLPGWKAPGCRDKCDAGSYGAGCGQTCGNCTQGTKCDHVTGDCPSGCQPGWQGSKCTAQCDAGSFGAGCGQTCAQCLNGTNCNHVTGNCPSGCQPGWEGAKCSTTCQNRMYGTGCTVPCGQCLLQPCDHISGSCTGGCVAGKTGSHCDNDCPTGFFGDGCTGRCGKCLENSCGKDGRCPGLCQDGWKGDTCNMTCSAGRYGTNCANTCGRCLNNAVCDRVTGNCPGGCVAGWGGSRCLQECSDGTYGEGCTLTCGNCAGGVACDKKDGTCTVCQQGFTLPLCKAEPGSNSGLRSEESTSNQGLGTGIGIGIGIGIGVSCLVVLTVVAIVYLRRRSYQGQGSGRGDRQGARSGETRSADNSVHYNAAHEEAEAGDKAPYDTLDAATRNAVVPSPYEEIRDNRGRL